jgi:hypothetical protein
MNWFELWKLPLSSWYSYPFLPFVTVTTAKPVPRRQFIFTFGEAGAVGAESMTTAEDDGDVHPAEFVTLNV